MERGGVRVDDERSSSNGPATREIALRCVRCVVLLVRAGDVFEGCGEEEVRAVVVGERVSHTCERLIKSILFNVCAVSAANERTRMLSGSLLLY